MKKYDDAVSPVVGVMLMLVVTIIIAAVVSGFAGSLASANGEKTPSVAMDIRVINDGHYLGSGFFATVTGASEPIPTGDLKIVTQWSTATGERGGNISIGKANNFNSYIGMNTNAVVQASVPFGFGAGVVDPANPTDPSPGNPTNPAGRLYQHFGNYTLMPGTSLSALPAPYHNGQAIGGQVVGSQGLPDSGYGIDLDSAYTYTAGTHYSENGTDAVEAVLGKGWEKLRTGDVVSVDVVHVPSGKTIFHVNVPVSEG